MAFYLKYRPKKVSELDLKEVRERLEKYVKSSKFSHAYLFVGPRGTGKTSAARLMAREAGVDQQDLVEMDAASYRGIDDVRELRERVALAPVAGEKKAYIIDEVHMLTKEAFNALLKTLEEPPKGVMFFLCTTELNKVPETVVSRCMRVDFRLAKTEELKRALERVIKAERLKLDEKAIKEIIKKSGGSFREAINMLEEASLGVNVENNWSQNSLRIEKLVQALGEKRLDEALNLVTDSWNEGVQPVDLAKEVLTLVGERMKQDKPWLKIAEVWEKATRGLNQSLDARIPIEIAIWKICDEEIPNLELKIKPNQAKESPQKISQKDEAVDLEILDKLGKPAQPKENRKCKYTLDEIKNKWVEWLRAVRPLNHSLEALLRACQPIGVEEGKVAVEVAYQFHKEQLEQIKHRRMIEEAWGVGVDFILKNKPTNDTIGKSAEDDSLAMAAEEILL